METWKFEGISHRFAKLINRALLVLVRVCPYMIYHEEGEKERRKKGGSYEIESDGGALFLSPEILKRMTEANVLPQCLRTRSRDSSPESRRGGLAGIQACLLLSLTVLFKAHRGTWSLTRILMQERYLSGTFTNKATDSLVKDVSAANISTGAGNLLGFFFSPF